MSPSDPQSRRNGQRSGMPLTDQFRADLVIELRILLQFPLAEKLQYIPAAHPALDHISRRFIRILPCQFCQRDHSIVGKHSHIQADGLVIVPDLLSGPQLFLIQRIVESLFGCVGRFLIDQASGQKGIDGGFVLKRQAYVPFVKFILDYASPSF